MACHFEYQALQTTGSPFNAIFGLPFVAVGLYLLIGRFFVDSRQRARTYYGVTSRRVLIVVAGEPRVVRSLALEGLDSISIQERTDATGTLVFGQGVPIVALHRSRGNAPPSLDMIPEVRRVYGIILDAQAALTPGRKSA